jgi:cysteinyl-tRNA synthetase
MFGLFSKEPEKTLSPVYFFNTASGKKELFVPLKKGEATMYSCGPTVYDHIHIGNLRAYLLPDLIKRTLLFHGYKVKNTINFTDFGHLTDDGDDGEDKMMKALKREGKPITLSAMKEVAETYIDSFKEDNKRFRNLPPTTYTPASDYVREQIALIKTLVDKGYAYETSDGVYFDISRFPKYGILGNVDINKMKEGARVEVNPEKKHPADFALWKKALLGWESDWGKGFPGWHIECTAMAFTTLGKQIDIHTGGEDLMYTHHNGEIAQAESATGKQYVRYWMHNRHLLIDNTKIAKSLGNGIRLQGLIDRGYSPESYRYFLLSGHYRSQMNFTFEALDAAKQALFRLKRYIFEEWKNERGKASARYLAAFSAALADDLDTPKAISLIWDIVKDATLSNGEKVATLKKMDEVLALGLSDDPDKAVRELGVVNEEDIPEKIKKLVEAREKARTNKVWDEADRIREAINIEGYAVDDTPEGPKISRR